MNVENRDGESDGMEESLACELAKMFPASLKCDLALKEPHFVARSVCLLGRSG